MILKNSKGERPIETINNSYVYPSPEIAIIPQGAKNLSPDGGHLVGDIILAPNETAYVITTKPTPYTSPINISFKENKCTGYLSEKYSFEPKLNRNCPLVQNDPYLYTVTKQCSDYIKTIYSCENPMESEREVFESKGSLCQEFIKNRANYSSCVIDHESDTDFYGKNWYVFLSRSTQMWTEDDSVTLMDRTGKIISTSNW
jgi:hypothetical protein